MSDTNPIAEDAIEAPAGVQQTEATEKVEAGDKANESTEVNGKDDSRTGGKYARANGRNGNRHDKAKGRETENFADLPESDDPREILDQIEFYFSAHNLSTDEHMFKELGGPANRPVSLKHVSTFNRMRRFKPYSAIVDAVRDSESLELVEDGEYSGTGNEGVKRKEPIHVPGYKPGDTTHWEDLFRGFKKSAGNKLETSIYAKNFGNPDEAGQIALEKFFKPYGAVVVRKRREQPSNKWKGSVFVEFENVDTQKEFLKLDPKPTFSVDPIEAMGKKEYNEMKCQEKGIEPGSYNPTRDHQRSRDSRGRGRGGRGRGNQRGRHGGHGGRGGRYNDRRDDRDNRRRRSASRDSTDSRDWNSRRDKFQKSRDNKGDRRDRADKQEPFELPKDENGVPVVRDTRGEPDPKSNKRKAADEHENTPKKSKVEIKEDA